MVPEDVRSAEVAVPASREEGELCVQESDLFAEGCISLTPTSNFSEVQEIFVQREKAAWNPGYLLKVLTAEN